jgi:hypothetical protein
MKTILTILVALAFAACCDGPLDSPTCASVVEAPPSSIDKCAYTIPNGISCHSAEVFIDGESLTGDYYTIYCARGIVMIADSMPGGCAGRSVGICTDISE